jgi:hypothetical protein
MTEEAVLKGDPEDPPIPVASAGSESEDDVSAALSATRASLSSTDWTIETIVRQLRKGRIDLNPKFQRRAAWTDATKSRFIESAILSYPIPQLVLAEVPEKPGHFFVIDGKQRLLAVRQFYAGQNDELDTEFDPLALTALTILPDLKGFDIEDLEAKRADLFDTFENHTIRTVVVRDWKSEDFLFTLFLRLNTGSVALSPQELRQALVPGPFVDFVDEQSGASPGLRALLGNDGPDRRMVDAELLVRFLGFNLGAVKYRGNLKVFLDETCRSFNGTWQATERQIEDHVRHMEEAISAAQHIFGREAACHKWSGTRWERSFNKAIFDVQIAALLDPTIREAALQSADEVREEFLALCVDDTDFSTFVSTTTKSLPATHGRFSKWFATVSRVVGRDLALPPALVE